MNIPEVNLFKVKEDNTSHKQRYILMFIYQGNINRFNNKTFLSIKKFLNEFMDEFECKIKKFWAKILQTDNTINNSERKCSQHIKLRVVI